MKERMFIAVGSLLISFLSLAISFLALGVLPSISKFYYWPANIIGIGLRSEWRDLVIWLAKASGGGHHLLEILVIVVFWWPIYVVLTYLLLKRLHKI